MKNRSFKGTALKTARSIFAIFPILFGILLLVGILNTVIPPSFYSSIFTKNIFLDSLIGASLGSLLFGNPMTSYILGGEFLNSGISLIAVIAFIISWVTVGIIQFPLESKYLGAKFAVIRNILSFIFSIIVAVLTALILGVL